MPSQIYLAAKLHGMLEAVHSQELVSPSQEAVEDIAVGCELNESWININLLYLVSCVQISFK